MTPTTQTITGDGGDCYRACVAAILDLPVESVPHFLLTGDIHAAARAWLGERGISLLPIYFASADALQHTHFDFTTYCVLSGRSPRLRADGRNRMHAVVGRTRAWGVEVLHDPHPDRAGLIDTGERWVNLIVVPPAPGASP